jgi:hypothetical protein
MKLRNLITAAAVAALPFLAPAAQAATLIVPAAGTGPGANASQWQSELTLHTAAPRPVALSITFHRGSDVLGPVAITLQPRQTLSIEDVVRTKFGVASGNGALVIEVSDRDARSLAVTSRTFNVSPTGEFGQDIPAVDATAALRVGDIAALSGPAVVGTNRFNFGIYATEAATIDWQVVRAGGTVAATKSVGYAAGTHAQYNGGIETLIGVTPQANDTVHARVTSGRAIFYGSIINATGDPTFIPGIRTREDILIQLTGVDLDENGSIDLHDANGDGVLDTPVPIFKSIFPNYFQVVAEGEFGEAVTLEVISGPGHTQLLDADGTLIVIAGVDPTGTTGAIVLRATSNGTSQLLTIPVVFR